MGTYDNTIMVIGACGFIGTHLLERLISEENNVIAFDNKSLGQFKYIKDFYTEDYFNAEVFTIDKLHQYPKIPLVFHMGMPSSYKMYTDNKHLYAYTIKDFLTVLEYCRQWDSKLVYASTASLYYGNSIPFKETMAIHPKDLYSECHYEMERLAELYSSLYDITTIGLRFFNIYGTREEHKGTNASIITQFIEQISAGIEPIVYGDGRQTRDFIYIDDVIEALMLCMKTKVKGSTVLNLGTGTNYSFNDIVDLIGESLNIEVAPVYKELTEKNYVYHSMADMELTNKVLKYKPSTSAIDGIKKIIAFGLYKGLFKDEDLFKEDDSK